MFADKVKGIFLVALAVMWQGVGTSLVGNLVDPSQSIFITFVAFLAATVISSIIYIYVRKIGIIFPVRRVSRKTIIYLNIFTAGAFCLFYISATMIPPAAASVIETGIGPFIVSLTMLKTVSSYSKLRILAFPLLVFLLTLIFVLLQEMQYTITTALGTILAVLAGSAAVGVLYSSQAAIGEGANALQIAASRFYLAWMVSGLIVLCTTQDSLAGADLFQNLLLSVLCITCPILLLQWGITLVSPLVSSLIIAWLPAIVLGTDILLGNPFSPGQIFILGAIVCASSMPILLPKKV